MEDQQPLRAAANVDRKLVDQWVGHQAQPAGVDHSQRIRLLEQELQRLFDRQLEILTDLKKLRASQRVSDADFIRRVYLDVLGIPPPAADVRKFLDDKRSSAVKRAILIDDLLSSPDYNAHWAEQWSRTLMDRHWEQLFKKRLADPAKKDEK